MENCLAALIMRQVPAHTQIVLTLLTHNPRVWMSTVWSRRRGTAEKLSKYKTGGLEKFHG